MKLYKLQLLTKHQWAWVWVAYWRLWIVIMRIKLKQGQWLREKIRPAEHIPSELPRGSDLKFDQMHEAVRIAARLHFFKAACLPKSIVLSDMLRARDHNARVLLGVSKDGAAIASHAWVEVDGLMIAEPESVGREFSRVI